MPSDGTWLTSVFAKYRVSGNVEKSRQPSLKLRLTSQRFHACRAYFAEVSYEG